MLFQGAEVTKLLSKSPLLKARYFVVQDEDTVIIDSNERMAAKIEELANKLQEIPAEEIDDAFSEGIEASEVDALLTDSEEGNVIHSSQTMEYDGPSYDEMIAAAEAEIQQMRQRAEEEIEQLRQSVMKEAELEGRESGYHQGFEEGLIKGQNEYEAKQKEIKEKENMLVSQYERKLAEVEPILVDTLSNIYEHIFEVDLSGHRNIVMHLIENTLHRIDGCMNYIVRVSKEDYGYVSMQKQAVLDKCVVGSAKLEIVEDITLSANECLIETESGIYDCSLGTELKELKKQLMLLAYEG